MPGRRDAALVFEARTEAPARVSAPRRDRVRIASQASQRCMWRAGWPSWPSTHSRRARSANRAVGALRGKVTPAVPLSAAASRRPSLRRPSFQAAGPSGHPPAPAAVSAASAAARCGQPVVSPAPSACASRDAMVKAEEAVAVSVDADKARALRERALRQRDAARSRIAHQGSSAAFCLPGAPAPAAGREAGRRQRVRRPQRRGQAVRAEQGHHHRRHATLLFGVTGGAGCSRAGLPRPGPRCARRAAPALQAAPLRPPGTHSARCRPPVGSAGGMCAGSHAAAAETGSASAGRRPAAPSAPGGRIAASPRAPLFQRAGAEG